MNWLTPLDKRKDSLRKYIDEMLGDDFLKLPAKDFFPETRMRTDIRETDKEYVLEAELPGFEKKEIKINIKDNYLIISAEKKEEIEEKTEDYIRKERSYGSLRRSFYLENIKEGEIKAKFDNGILTVVLPKSEEIKKEEKIIDIE